MRRLEDRKAFYPRKAMNTYVNESSDDDSDTNPYESDSEGENITEGYRRWDYNYKQNLHYKWKQAYIDYTDSQEKESEEEEEMDKGGGEETGETTEKSEVGDAIDELLEKEMEQQEVSAPEEQTTEEIPADRTRAPWEPTELSPEALDKSYLPHMKNWVNHENAEQAEDELVTGNYVPIDYGEIKKIEQYFKDYPAENIPLKNYIRLLNQRKDDYLNALASTRKEGQDEDETELLNLGINWDKTPAAERQAEQWHEDQLREIDNFKQRQLYHWANEGVPKQLWEKMSMGERTPNKIEAGQRNALGVEQETSFSIDNEEKDKVTRRLFNKKTGEEEEETELFTAPMKQPQRNTERKKQKATRKHQGKTYKRLQGNQRTQSNKQQNFVLYHHKSKLPMNHLQQTMLRDKGGWSAVMNAILTARDIKWGPAELTWKEEREGWYKPQHDYDAEIDKVNDAAQYWIVTYRDKKYKMTKYQLREFHDMGEEKRQWIMGYPSPKYEAILKHIDDWMRKQQIVQHLGIKVAEQVVDEPHDNVLYTTNEDRSKEYVPGEEHTQTAEILKQHDDATGGKPGVWVEHKPV